MPKLSPEMVSFIHGGELTVPVRPEWGPATRAAVELAQGGIRVFPCDTYERCMQGICSQAGKNGEAPGEPCASPGKHPRIRRGVLVATTNIGQVLQWATAWPKSNWGQALDTRLAVDIDVAEGKGGMEQWEALLAARYPDRTTAGPWPEDLRTLRYTTGRGGVQLVFERPAGVRPDDVRNKLADHIDIKRGRGDYIMVPGSETQGPYTVTLDRPPLVAPGWIIQEAKSYAAARKAAKTRAAKAAGSPSGKGLSAELALSVDDPGKGNDWATRVAGFLAAGLRREEDLAALLRIINVTQLKEPMPDAMVVKIARSVVEAEARNHHGTKDGDLPPETDALHDVNSGYLALAADKRALLVLNSLSHGEDEPLAAPQAYLDCGIIPRYVMDTGDNRYYDLEVFGPNHTGGKHSVVSGETLVDPKLRDRWLAGLGYAVSPPFHPTYEIADKARLLRFVEAQKPQRGVAVDCLGWHGTDFLTPEGVLRDGELLPFDGKIPRPQAVEQSMAAYGLRAGVDELVGVLRDVWTFQEPEVASVSMAWWVMCLLKGRYRSSISPILYVDAPSGSGKTNGFFAFLVALAGNTSGSGSITVPRVRHQLASNRNGIVWVDDMSEMRNLAEVLRQAASKGTHTKTDTGDNKTTISQHMVGNVLLSCEGMGRTLDEKAMRDRVIHLKVRSVKGRQSRSGGRAQWFDILDLLDRYGARSEDYAPFAHQMAGTAVSLLAPYATVRLEDHMEKGDGRHAEKHAILRAGAEILCDVLGFDEPRQHVAAWLEGDEDRGGENLFVSHLAGRIWREWGQPDSQAVTRFGQQQVAPVFVERGTVFVSPQHCADAVENIRGLDARDRQLGSREAIIAELQDCGLTARGCRVERRVNGQKVSYWRLSGVLSAVATGVRRPESGDTL